MFGQCLKKLNVQLPYDPAIPLLCIYPRGREGFVHTKTCPQISQQHYFLIVLHWERRQWHPTPVLLPGKSHGRRSLEGCSPWGRWGLDTTEQLHFHFSLSCIGEGNGNPLQCSCLEKPRDGGAWWAAAYGVAQSQTRLKRLSSKLGKNSNVREQINKQIMAHLNTIQWFFKRNYFDIHNNINEFQNNYTEWKKPDQKKRVHVIRIHLQNIPESAN